MPSMKMSPSTSSQSPSQSPYASPSYSQSRSPDTDSISASPSQNESMARGPTIASVSTIELEEASLGINSDANAITSPQTTPTEATLFPAFPVRKSGASPAADEYPDNPKFMTVSNGPFRMSALSDSCEECAGEDVESCLLHSTEERVSLGIPKSQADPSQKNLHIMMNSLLRVDDSTHNGSVDVRKKNRHRSHPAYARTTAIQNVSETDKNASSHLQNSVAFEKVQEECSESMRLNDAEAAPSVHPLESHDHSHATNSALSGRSLRLLPKLPKLGWFPHSQRGEDGTYTFRNVFSQNNMQVPDAVTALDNAVHSRASLHVVLDLYNAVENLCGSMNFKSSSGSLHLHSSRRAATIIHRYLLCNGSVAEAAIRTLLLVQVPNFYSTLDTHALNKHRVILANLLTGQLFLSLPSIILRRPRARTTVFAFLEHVTFPTHTHDPDLLWRTSIALSMINSALIQQPHATAAALSARTGLLRTIAVSLGAVPGAAELLARLVAADPLDEEGEALGNSSSGGGGDSKSSLSSDTAVRSHEHDMTTKTNPSSLFPVCGAANPSGILALSNDGVCSALVQTFVNGCETLMKLSCKYEGDPSKSLSSTPFHQLFSPTQNQETDPDCCTCITSSSLSNPTSPSSSSSSLSSLEQSSAPWARISFATRTLAEVCIRSVLVPQFSRANCSFAPRATRTLNNALSSLSLFTETTHVRALLHAAFPKDEPLQLCMHAGHCAWAVLSCIVSVMRVVRTATHPCAPAALRRVLCPTNSSSVHLEKEVIAALPRINCVLRMQSHQRFARSKLAACELVAALATSPNKETKNTLADADIANSLMHAATEITAEAEASRKGNCNGSGLTPLQVAVVECARVCATGLIGKDDNDEGYFKADSDEQEENDLAADVGIVASWARAVARLMQQNEHEVGMVVVQVIGAVRPVWPRVRRRCGGLLSDGDVDAMDRAVCLAMDLEQTHVGLGPCGGPKPEGMPKMCLLASAKSLASRLDDVDAV